MTQKEKASVTTEQKPLTDQKINDWLSRQIYFSEESGTGGLSNPWILLGKGEYAGGSGQLVALSAIKKRRKIKRSQCTVIQARAFQPRGGD